MEGIENLARQIGRHAGDLGLTVGVAESLTGGLVVQALARVDGSSGWLRGGVVAYDRNVKHRLLQVRVGKVVSEAAAVDMAIGARKVLEADVAVALTGVGGPRSRMANRPGPSGSRRTTGPVRGPHCTGSAVTQRPCASRPGSLRWPPCAIGLSTNAIPSSVSEPERPPGDIDTPARPEPSNGNGRGICRPPLENGRATARHDRCRWPRGGPGDQLPPTEITRRTSSCSTRGSSG